MGWGSLLCLNSLCALHGNIQVGLGLIVRFIPAILAAGAPELTAFMSDEAMESVPGLKPIQYTPKHYALYLDRMAAQSAKLNKGFCLQFYLRFFSLYLMLRVF